MASFPSYAVMLVEGASQQRATAIQRTQMESGPPKQLKTRSRVMVTRPAAALFKSLADFNSFITWFQTTINYGADWFTFTDPVDSSSKNGRIVSQLDSEEPSSSELTHWVVKFKLETWSG